MRCFIILWPAFTTNAERNMVRKRPTRHVQTARITMAEKKKPYEDQNLIDVKSPSPLRFALQEDYTHHVLQLRRGPPSIPSHSNIYHNGPCQYPAMNKIDHLFSTWTCSSLNAAGSFPYYGPRRLWKMLKKTGSSRNNNITTTYQLSICQTVRTGSPGPFQHQTHLNHRRDFCAEHLWVFLHIL